MLRDRLKGSRGEWYLVVQAVIFLLLGFGPRGYQLLPVWPYPYSLIATVSGVVLMLAGTLLALAGTNNLGRNLTPLPKPKRDTFLVVTGAYALVRHPIYSGLILFSFGLGFWLQSWLTLVYAILLLLFFDIKSRREEKWLVDVFPEYVAYRKRAKKLIPFIY
ncbi:MAG: isoprenylcysteine carboxylmethyltransferase family protein [Desulfuromonadaceae bacterium]|nr:isoprenylcysteine carboxylmethyltransferase family protein [Desulfuromonadaceae bacterium]MDD2854159.1 isoprenylcysteine carboxylmethyltransferase family protein [Desulfuromonadaceae bacterium]